MEELDYTIIEFNGMIELLNQQRDELIAMKEDLEMAEVFEYIIERGFTPNQVMQMISSPFRAKKIARNPQ